MLHTISLKFLQNQQLIFQTILAVNAQESFYSTLSSLSKIELLS
jgi:hypothetical protein